MLVTSEPKAPLPTFKKTMVLKIAVANRRRIRTEKITFQSASGPLPHPRKRPRFAYPFLSKILIDIIITAQKKIRIKNCG